jgi:very-short-patch-repair endonuclease
VWILDAPTDHRPLSPSRAMDRDASRVNVSRHLRSHGGIASRQSLLAAGSTDREIRAAIAAGRIARLRNGWFADGSAPSEVVRAVRAGGVLTCASALRLQGVWTMPHPEVHVRLKRGTPRPSGADLRLHWSDDTVGLRFPMDAVLGSLRQLLRCADTRACVVALDSALHAHLVAPAALELMLEETARGRALAALIDPAAESGIETLARLALRRARLRHRTQVPIAGVGHVDLMIGDRLVLEVDGYEWHSQESDLERDKARDRALVAAGYLVMRATYRQVMEQWDGVEEQILAVVRRNGHLWSRSRR